MAIKVEYEGLELEFPDGTPESDIYTYLDSHLAQQGAQSNEKAVQEEPPVVQDPWSIQMPDRTPKEVAIDEKWFPQSAPEAPMAAAQNKPSAWAPTLEEGVGMRPGYRGDGTVNYDDPRWRGMNPYSIEAATSRDGIKETLSNVWDTITTPREGDAYTNQARANRDDLTRPLKAPAPEQRGQESMDPEKLKEIYGDKPSMWDKFTPDAADMPQASAPGTTLIEHIEQLTDQRVAETGEDRLKAEREIMDEQMRIGMQLGASVLAAPAAVGVGILGGMAIEGGVSAVSGAASDYMSKGEVDISRVIEDAASGAAGAGIGGLAGKALTKSIGGQAVKDADMLRNPAISQINELGESAKLQSALADITKDSTKLDTVLPGTNSITARDVLDASNRAKTASKVNKAGATVDTSTIADNVANEELGKLLKMAGSKGETVSKLGRKVDDVTGLPLRSLAGLDAGITGTKAKKAVKEVIDGMGTAINESRTTISSAIGDSAVLKKRYETLGQVQQLISKGKLEEARKPLAQLRQTDAVNRKELGATAAEEIQALASELGALAGLKNASNAANEGTLVGLARRLNLPVGFAMWHNPGATIAAKGAQKAIGKGMDAATKTRVDEINRALGGKIKVDEKARQMLENGEDTGRVIGYLVMKASGLTDKSLE